MVKQVEKTGQPSTTEQEMSSLVSQYITQCIRCHRCMDVCPVTKGTFTIDELNTASQQKSLVPEKIKTFAFRCVQCGKCAPVCPVNIRREYMVRYIKSKMKDQKPWSYTRYLLIKGPNMKGMKGFLQKLYISFQKITTRDLACFMETTPAKKADVLFYPGCYLYSKKTVRRTLRLLDHLGCSYTVLGGVTSCCGAPHLLQGEFDQADQCLEQLYQKIKTVQPKLILTSCAECYEALEKLKREKNEVFELLSVVEYLSQNIDKFPKVRMQGTTLVHDSCRFKKDSRHGQAARITVETFGDLKEQENTQGSPCCYQWNHGYDPGNTSRQKKYLEDVRTSVSTLACTCITCYEELKKLRTDVEVIDVVQLYENALDAKPSKEKT